MTDAGHVRIGNRLAEAIAGAPFEKVQLRFVLAIVRLTAGWQRRSVVATYKELATYVGCSMSSGGSRRQLQELVREGVVLCTPFDGQANAYAIQDDYEKWGRFSQSTAKLEALWSKRPEHADEQLPLRILEIGRGGTRGEKIGEKLGANPDPIGSGSERAGNATLTLQGQTPSPYRVRPPDPIGSGSPIATPDRTVGSEAGKTGKTGKTTPNGGRGEAMELLTALDALREPNPAPGGDGEIIRLDKVRQQLGAIAVDVLKLIGGAGRLIATKPEHRGILIADVAKALERIRSRPPREEATGT